MNTRKINVYFNQEMIGTLTEKHGNFLYFSYIPDAKYDISFSLKRGQEPFNRNLVKNFFENLLPEGDILDLVSKAYLVSKNNPFSVLSVIGEDCAGALTITNDLVLKTKSKKPFSEELLKEFILKAQKGLIHYEKGMRLSIAGVQNKTTIFINSEGNYYIPNFFFPSTHIIKFENSYYTNILINEYFCTLLASSLGLNTSYLNYIEKDDLLYLKIERFDRKNENGVIRRIHVEDFAQITGTPSSRKYEIEGGPGFKDIVRNIQKHSYSSIKDVISLAKILVFNFLIGNNDYHAKNLSMLHEPKNELTPFYDLLSTTVYDDLSKTMAMHINKVKESEVVTKEDIIEEFNSWNLKGNLIFNNIINDFKNIIKNAYDLLDATDFINHKKFIMKIIKTIEINFNKLT